jgi:FMN-dependent NADH-azoreductase
MSHLHHVDSSIRGYESVTRALTARAANVWRAAHPGGTVTYRDLGADPVPHLDTAGGLARMVPPDQHTPAQAASWALSQQLVAEIAEADTILHVVDPRLDRARSAEVVEGRPSNVRLPRAA